MIEVVAALLIFSMGVIMLLKLTGALSASLERSAIASVITAEGQERMDSMAALAYSSLPVATKLDTMVVRGVPYRRTQAITQYSPLVRKVSVTLGPVSGTGPTYDAILYRYDAW